MCVPIIFFGKRFVDTVVEVFVVGKYDVTTNVVELSADQSMAFVLDRNDLNPARDVQNLRG